MIAELVSIGTELLMGQIANTDAQYISQKLSEVGIDLYYQDVVGDNPQRLKNVMELALSRADIVITTGGLGPTKDDLTKETIAEMLNLPMVEDEYTVTKLKATFARMGSKITENNFRQAMFPQGCIILENFAGTAPGCIVEKDGKTVIILPGPPHELKKMFETSVVPYLSHKTNAIIHSKILHIFGMGESLVEDTIQDLIEKQTNPTIAPYAGLAEVTLRLSAKCGKDEDPEAIFEPVEKEIYSRIGKFIYAEGDVTMAQVVAKLILESGKKIAIAESCTGGMICSDLVATPGISEALLEGIVSYSNESKVKRLGVSQKTLDTYGAVSRETAIEMAKGLVEQGADLAVSTTGIAGPGGGTEDKPVGLVYIGIASKDTAYAKEIRANGSRSKIRTTACLHALDQLRRFLLEDGENTFA